MGLRDLFSRGPKLPEPVRDPFDGDEEARRAAFKLKAGEWREAATLLARTRDGDHRAFLAGTFAEAQGLPPWIEAWHAAESDRPEAWMIRGLMRIAWAWEARGSGRADDVDEDAWPVFVERLQEAEADLLEAIRLDDQDATPWGYLLITGRALEVELVELRLRFAEAQKRDPQGWLAPVMALTAFSEKWSGTHDIMFAFARELAAGAPEGSPLHAIIPMAHLERWLYFSMEDPPDRHGQGRYYQSSKVQEEIRRAWERGPGSPAFKPGRFATTQQALFAFSFGLGDDQARARAVFEKMGPRVTPTPWSYLGDPMDVFKRCRAAAYD